MGIKLLYMCVSAFPTNWTVALAENLKVFGFSDKRLAERWMSRVAVFNVYRNIFHYKNNLDDSCLL